MKKLAFIVLLLLVATLAQSQSDTLSKNAQYASLNIGARANTYAGDLSLHYDWHFGKRRRIVVGSGLRFQAFGGSNVYFTSAPPAFAEDLAKQDSLLAPAPWIYSLNGIINLGYFVTPKLFLGFNIDAYGLSFGPNGSPTFIQDGVEQTAKVKPTLVNKLLVGTRDEGSLKAQFIGRYYFNEHWGVQLGIQNLFNELTTDALLQTIPANNRRFRAASSQGFIGVNYKF